MKQSGNLKLIVPSKLNIALFAGAFILTLVLVVVISRFFGPEASGTASRRIFLKEGYDFRQMHLLNQELAESELGSRIELADLQTSKREKLLSLVKGELILLAVVDPGCAACESSKDIMLTLRKNTDELGIKYLPIVLRKFPPDLDTQGYAETLGFDTCIEWPPDVALPDLFRSIGTPTHVLITKDGLVLNVWHGTAVQQETRKRMADQISSDLYLIDRTVRAMRFQPSG